jgi:16S rRNA (adenine1518-N6/adenine1519-N6)-dimethyltransferase
MDTGRKTRDMPPARNLRELCQRYDIRFKKALGQNLLLDDNINRIMVDAAALTLKDDVIEVGAGLGALTRRLCAGAGRVLAVEIDRSFMPCLEDQFGHMDHVRLFRGDVLNHPLQSLLDEFLPGSTAPKMVSNLPYYITTPLLFHFLEAPVWFPRLVVMMQDEVGQRLVAPPGSHDYGTLALGAQCYGRVDIVHRVPRTCFVPRPKVDSCIVRFRCPEKPPRPELDQVFFMKVVRAAFEQRRKTLVNSLSGSHKLQIAKETALAALETAGIDPGRRAQTLEFDEFLTLSNVLKEIMHRDPGGDGS